MKNKNTALMIIIVSAGLVYFNFVPQFLKATPNSLSSQELKKEGLLLADTLIQNKHIEFWINNAMWRFTTLPKSKYELIKAYATQALAKHLLKESTTTIRMLTREENRPENIPSPQLPMEVD